VDIHLITDVSELFHLHRRVDINKHPEQCNKPKGRYLSKTRCKGLKRGCLMSPTSSANVHNCLLRICLLHVPLGPSPSSKSAQDLQETLTLCIPSDPQNFRTCAALCSRYLSLQKIMSLHFLRGILSTSFSADHPQDLFTKSVRPLSYAKETERPNCFRLSQKGKNSKKDPRCRTHGIKGVALNYAATNHISLQRVQSR
jgi:hypothetical protein